MLAETTCHRLRSTIDFCGPTPAPKQIVGVFALVLFLHISRFKHVDQESNIPTISPIVGKVARMMGYFTMVIVSQGDEGTDAN